MRRLQHELSDVSLHHQNLLTDWQLLELRGASVALPKLKHFHERLTLLVVHQLHRRREEQLDQRF
jgi:hypothetical protein